MGRQLATFNGVKVLLQNNLCPRPFFTHDIYVHHMTPSPKVVRFRKEDISADDGTGYVINHVSFRAEPILRSHDHP